MTTEKQQVKNQLRIELTAKQALAHNYLSDKEDRAILYGGAKGGGKSYLLCLWVYHWVEELIRFFDIKNPKYPVPLGFIGRKRAVDFNDTTFETFKNIIPQEDYEIRTQDKEIVLWNKAKICFGGLDDQANINKFNSAEFCFVAIDQAEETMREDVGVLQASLRFKYNGKTPPYKELYTANPAECWLKDEFIIGNRDNGVFIPALPDDNPYLPENYKATLRNAFAYDPALLKAYLEGDWDAFSNTELAVFKAQWFAQCRNKEDEEYEEDALRIVAADVATKHGDNETVIIYRYGHIIKEIHRFKKISTTQIAFKIKELYERKKANVCVVDSDGFGEGVADVLSANRIGVAEFHGGYAHKAMDGKRFRNLRSQFYDITAKKMEKGFYSLKNIEQGDFEALKRQACLIQTKKPDGMMRYQVESKEDMKARRVSSPDILDALIYSEYGFYMGNFAEVKPYKYMYR